MTAIESERQAVKLNALSSEAPKDLPKKLQGERKTCIKEIEKAEGDLEKAAKKINSAYVTALNAVPGTSENQQLADWIAAEKKRLLYGIGKPVLNLQTDLAGTRWKYPGKDGVMSFSADGTWEGHKLSFPKPNVVTIHFSFGGSATLTLAETGNVLMGDGKINMVLYRGKAR